MARLATRIALVLAVSSSALMQFPQEREREPEAGERDIFGRPLNAEPHYDLLQSMQGGWRLVEIEDEALPLAGRTQAGFFTFADRFMAVELHMSWADGNGETVEDAFQSGIHEIEFIGPARIRTRTLIGAYLDEFEELEWEVAGFSREFDINVSGDQLTLTRDIGSRLILRRQTVARSVLTDIFGVPEGSRDDVDIFGAPVLKPEPEPEVVEEEDDDDDEDNDD